MAATGAAAAAVEMEVVVDVAATAAVVVGVGSASVSGPKRASYFFRSAIRSLRVSRTSDMGARRSGRSSAGSLARTRWRTARVEIHVCGLG